MLKNKSILFLFISVLMILLTAVFIFYGSNIEVEILKNLNLNRNKQFDSFFQFLSKTTGYLAWGTPIVLLILSFVRKHKMNITKSIYIGLSIIGSSLIANILKYTIDRPRPFSIYPIIEKLSSGGSPSFPSGHSCDAFVIAAAISIVYPKWYIIGLTYFWAGAVAYSRLSLGVHYPSDVLAGIIIGTTSAVLCYVGYLSRK